MKMHLSFDTRDLDRSIAFYAMLLGMQPVKQLADYALFVSDDPGLELALNRDPQAGAGSGEHYGIVVESAEAVDAQIARFETVGAALAIEREETCCYAVQTKVWVSDPDGRRWETYVVHAESEERDGEETACCS